MDDLITIVRTYIEDEDSPYYVSDTIITRQLNKSRRYVADLTLYAEDYYYDNLSKTYKIGYSFISGLTLKDGSDNTIASSNYTLDAFNGIVTFADGYDIPDYVYATFSYHDFFDTISELWKYMAAKARISGRAKLADEDIPMDKYNREYCIQKYWDWCQSKNLNMER